MEYGIDQTKDFLESFSDLICEAISIIKNGPGLSTLKDIKPIISSIQEITISCPGILPELSDLDHEESIQLGLAALSAVKKIVSMIIP